MYWVLKCCKTPRFFLTAFVVTFFLGGSSIAQEKRNYKYLRTGIGYHFVDNDSILSEKLQQSQIIENEKSEITNLPAECFRAPGITKIYTTDIQFERQIIAVSELLTLRGVEVSIECSGTKAITSTFLEVSEDGQTWYIFNNPAEAVVNNYLIKMVSEQWGRPDKDSSSSFIVEETDKGHVRIMVDGIENTKLVLGQLNGRFYGVIDSTSNENQSQLMRQIEKQGYNAIIVETTDSDRYRTAIDFGKPDKSNIIKFLHTNQRQSMRFMIDELKIREAELTRSLEESLDGLREKYGRKPN